MKTHTQVWPGRWLFLFKCYCNFLQRWNITKKIAVMRPAKASGCIVPNKQSHGSSFLHNPYLDSNELHFDCFPVARSIWLQLQVEFDLKQNKSQWTWNRWETTYTIHWANWKIHWETKTGHWTLCDLILLEQTETETCLVNSQDQSLQAAVAIGG